MLQRLQAKMCSLLPFPSIDGGEMNSKKTGKMLGSEAQGVSETSKIVTSHNQNCSFCENLRKT